MSRKKIAVVGLGYVGLPLATALSSVHSVVGYDIDPKRVTELLQGIDHTGEVTDADLLGNSDLTVSSDKSILCNSEIFIITVPTPVNADNSPNLDLLIAACRTVGEVLQSGATVIVESTVFPGATEEICVPVIQDASGLKYACDSDDHNHRFHVGYSPERINPGDKNNSISSVVKVISANSDFALDILRDVYQPIIKAGLFEAQSIKVAEMAKVIENTQRDLNIAFVNEVALICQKLEIDTNDVLQAAGTKWNFLRFVPGLVGGHCIGVDPYYLTHKAKKVGVEPRVTLAGRRTNDQMPIFLAQLLLRKLSASNVSICKARVGVLGFTFKENCPDVRNTKVFDLAEELDAWGASVFIWDPMVSNDTSLGLPFTFLQTPSFTKLDAIIVAVAHDEIRELELEDILTWMCSDSEKVLLDVKNVYRRRDLQRLGFNVIRL